MNAGVSSEKEKVKWSQSRSVTPSLDTHFGCRVGGVTEEEKKKRREEEMKSKKVWNYDY